MLKIGTIRWKGKCSKHPRYDPGDAGEGGLVGGCARCIELLEIFQSHKKTVALLRAFGPGRDLKPKPAEPTEDRQIPLFKQ